MQNSESNFIRTIFLLSVCLAFSGSTSSMTVSASSLVGFGIADNKALATLPLSFHLLGTMLAGIPASLLMKRVGRRYGSLRVTREYLPAWCPANEMKAVRLPMLYCPLFQNQPVTMLILSCYSLILKKLNIHLKEIWFL
jgi:hypothetical protein